MDNSLFDAFDAVSGKQWKQKIQFDLKGADYNSTLIWESHEGIAVKPFYTAEDLNAQSSTCYSKRTGWNVCQPIYVADAARSNKKALISIEKGADSILFILPSESISIEDLLIGIDLNTSSVYFELQFLSYEYVQKIMTYQHGHGVKTGSHNIHISTDIIGHLSKNGNWFNTLNDDFQVFVAIVQATKSFNVNMALYQNAGANMVQQLAYALAHANEYLNVLDKKLSAQDSKHQISCTFHVAVGTNYFFEIAKLRALRLLWNTLASEYHIDTVCHMIATPTKRNKTLYDYNTNLLRTTTECMSAVVGGADTIINLAFDSVYHKTNEFSERIARNQLLILKHESHFDKVDNPADGAYYIETLTQQLAEKALLLFKEIELSGGFLKQLKVGTIQRKIKESAAKEQKQFDEGEEVLVGSNKYINPTDVMKAKIELYPFVKIKSRKTLIEPIIENRLSETLEQKRLKKEA
ncbi:methylmalonyl-CoA mutase subunit beta [Mariniflexile ostreae]|uniref:Methylmalonyl-CoA mutase subunit beta n=1 Tax=Mariniflexile ostreae TaxID=1520892 RepID=A0ABV5F8N8_9FLAO